jgi:hypothetical protein
VLPRQEERNPLVFYLDSLCAALDPFARRYPGRSRAFCVSHLWPLAPSPEKIRLTAAVGANRRVSFERISGARPPSGGWLEPFAPGFDEEPHAMKKLFVIAVLGTAALAMTSAKASAGWLHCWSCKHHCVMSLTCTQYNAFSPFCCDQANGCVPLQAFANACNGSNCGPSCVGGACLGELPAPAAGGHALLNPTPNGVLAMPATGMPVYSGVVGSPMPNATMVAPPAMTFQAPVGNGYPTPTLTGAAPAPIGQ